MFSSRTKWILSNAALLGSLYLGQRDGFIWIAYCAVAAIWIVLVMYATLYFTMPPHNHKNPVPFWWGLAVDAAALFLLLSNGWVYTGTAYLLSAVLLNALYWHTVTHPSRILGRR